MTPFITGRSPSCRNITLFQGENTSIYSHDDFQPVCLPKKNIALLKWYKNFTQKYTECLPKYQFHVFFSSLADVLVISQAESMQKCFTKAPCRIRLANAGSNENCGPRFLVKQSDRPRPNLRVAAILHLIQKGTKHEIQVVLKGAHHFMEYQKPYHKC